VQRRLRRAGYGFRLPNPDDIADALCQAPLRDGQIVETERLSLYRTDCAFQLVKIRHLTDLSWGSALSSGRCYRCHFSALRNGPLPKADPVRR